MHARYPLARYGKQTERIVIAKILFLQEWESRQVSVRLEVVRMNAVRVEAAPIVLYVLIGVSHRPLQPLELYCSKLIGAGSLQIIRICAHADSSVSTTRPLRGQRSHNSGQLPEADSTIP